MQTRKLAQGAIAAALATVLSMFTLFRAPYGGSVTMGSMVPILLYGLMYGPKWGMMASGAYIAIQMLTGFYPPPTPALYSFLLVIFLDYVLAFGVLGLAEPLGRPFGRKKVVMGSTLAVLLRFLAHFLSGMVIWGVYAPEGQPVWLYSLTYNGGYMAGELVVTLLLMVLITRSVPLARLKGETAGQ
jgi:thiamine transporter